MCATATENSIHAFEKAGLGKAPFRIVGVGNKVGPLRYTDPKSGLTMEVGSPGQPMGVCKFCGQGIMECWSIKSADGNIFDVGCECVRKTGDAGMKKVIDAHKAKVNREKRQAKAAEDKVYVAGVIGDQYRMSLLRAIAHPYGFEDRVTKRPLSAAEYIEWMAPRCGDSGMMKLAKWLRKVLA